MTLITLIPYFFQGFFAGKFIRPLAKKSRKAHHATSNLTEETISNMRTVKAFANEQAELDRFCTKQEARYEREMTLI